MAMSGGKDDGSPMMDMNTTPLIDVMLVLLIMFIITIPPVTHAVKIDLPVASPPDPNEVLVDPVRNKLIILDTGVLLWGTTDGAPREVTLDQAASLMSEMKSMSPEPELQFQPVADAPYETVDKVLAEVRKAEVSKFGFVGNESYPGFEKAKANFK
jgi:biopolymer transport protein ExbD